MSNRNFEKLPLELELIGKKIVDASYSVHKNLGPGLLEKVYEICLCHELKKGTYNFSGKFKYQLCMME